MSKLLAIRVFTPFALGYLFVSIFRSINAVIAPDLVRDLGLSASELGFAISAFFLSATLIQLPYGVLLDRYDPRRLYAFFLVLCAAGAALAALADGIVMLALARALIALGTTASAVTSFKIYSMWFPPARLPLANGLSLAAGGLGLMAGTAPVEAALQFMDWRGVHLIVAGLLLANAGLVWLVAPAKPTERAGLTLMKQIRGIGGVAGSLVFWRAAPLMMMVLGIFGAFTQLWAGPWVRDVAGLSGQAAANLLLITAAAMTLSGLATGGLTALAKRAGLAPMDFAVAMAVLFALVLVLLFLQWTPSPLVVFATWGLFGFTATLNFVTYAALGPEFPAALAGRLNACLTLSWMLGAFLIQNLYGIILDQFPASVDGYSVQGHRIGVGVLIGLMLLALGWFFVASQIIRSQSKKALDPIRGAN